MRILVALIVAIGFCFVTVSADAATRKERRTEHVQKHIVKKAAKLQTKLVYAKRAHTKKHVQRKAKHLYKKAKKHHLVSATPPLPERKPALADNALVKKAVMYAGTNPVGWSHNWCGAFLDKVLTEAGYHPGGNLARGYASYGYPTHARVGAIAVMAHHVGIVAEVGPGYVTLVSGNHSGKSGHRTVGVGRYATSRVLTFRMPT